MSTFNMNRITDRMFRKADGVVWDLMTGKIGISTDDGIVTLEGEGDNARVNVNLMDEFGVALPAFAQSTPVEGIKVGDIIYSGKREKVVFVTGIVESTSKPARALKSGVSTPAVVEVRKFRVMDTSGSSSTWTPPKISMLGFDSGVMVLRSLMSMLPNGDKGLGQMQGMLLPMLAMSGGDLGGDLDGMLPLMLMSQMGGLAGGTDGGGMGNMMQMMFMMKLMGKGEGMSGLLGGGKSSSPFRQG